MRILVAGMVAGDPGQGGATWAVLQYVRGLQRLGHDVVTVEPVAELSEGVLAYFEALGLPRTALLEPGRRSTGLRHEELSEFDAELLLNISGCLRDPGLTRPIPTRVFLDLDPVFTQIWHAEGVDLGLDAHTHHLSLADSLVGLPSDRRWHPTLPPVVLDDWPAANGLEDDAFTTVGNWRSYGSVQWGGRHYGQKAHAVRRLLTLPQLCRQPLRVALGIHPDETADLEALAVHGWTLADPVAVAGTPDTYQRFVSGSRGELGVTKAGYVDAGCGWFSDRSACYLASGRPVVAADTGFGRRLPCGEGLLAFSDVNEAAAGLTRVAGDYDAHRAAARALAEEHLDSDRVLAELLEAVL